MASYAPARPPNERDVVQNLNGSPRFLGVLTSTGAAAVNNATTAVPFNAATASQAAGGKVPPGPASTINTLAGKILLVQPTAAGLILGAFTTTITIAQQTAVPSLVPPLAYPGILIGINERVEVTMDPTEPFLQFVAVAGTASLLVWEMV